MPSEYPSILFHFTNSHLILKKIVQETFRLSIAREKIENNGAHKEFGVPMVSFCDLRISQLRPHMKKYGCYGIGLSKEWAMKMGLNPVAYVSNNSEFTNLLIAGIQTMFNQLDTPPDPSDQAQLRSAYMNILNVERYVKNYSGKLVRNGKDLGDFTFADEKEWRYVLPLEENFWLSFVPIDKIDTHEKKSEKNKLANKYKLNFTAMDVKYLIVKTEPQVSILRSHISKLCEYSPSEKNHLMARILTSEQIVADM